MTQWELIIEYIKQNGSITPATLNDKNRRVGEGWLGSQTDKRCRELREHKLPSVQKYPQLVSEPNEKGFETFKFAISGEKMLNLDNCPLEPETTLKTQNLKPQRQITWESASALIEKQRQLRFLNKL